MAKTIIQTIGPLYGEVENGTVFGRPNGSVFVPSANTITASVPATFAYVRSTSTAYFVCNSSGTTPYGRDDQSVHVIAESQDIANYIKMQIADDAEFTNILDDTIKPAGQFNLYFLQLGYDASITPLVAGTTYYLRFVLVSASGEAVAVSNTLELTGVEV